MAKKRRSPRSQRRKQKQAPRNPLSQRDRNTIRMMREIYPAAIIRQYRQAALLIANGQFQQGVDALLTISGDETETLPLFTREKLTEVYLDHGVVHPALEPFSKADETDEPQEFVYYSCLAVAYGWRKQFDDARRIYAKRMRLLEQDEENLIETRIEIADTYRRDGDLERACEELEKIWADAPEYCATGHELALSYLRLNRKEDARGVYQQITAREGDDYQGIALLALRRSEEALRVFQAEIERYPRDGFPPYLAALAHLQLGSVASARRRLVEALSKDPSMWDEERQLFAQFALTPQEFDTLAEIWPR
jgi:tetratricopeptide (TPR) repeat protein